MPAALVLFSLGIGLEAQNAGPLPAPALRADDGQYGDLQGDHLKSLLMDVDAISLADRARGTVFWGRNVGTQGHVDTENWVEAHFRRLDLSDIHRLSFDLSPQWMASSYAIAFSGGGKTLHLASARPARSASTPAGGSEWALAWGGEGTEADFAGRDVRGKAVLIQDLLLPGDIRHSAQLDRVVERAFDHGAVAVGLIFGVADNFAIWPATGGRPGFSVGFEDGKVLRDLLGAGEDVRVTLDLQSEMRAGLTTASVFGSLPGTTDEDITILAHMDGYFEGALDNASGLAVLVGLAEHFAKVPAAQRRRTIRFVGSAGHHGGPGARWFHDNKDTALAHTVLAINLEHVAAVRTQVPGATTCGRRRACRRCGGGCGAAARCATWCSARSRGSTWA